MRYLGNRFKVFLRFVSFYASDAYITVPVLSAFVSKLVVFAWSRRQGAEFLVCCQPSMNLFFTRNFRILVAGFLDDSSLHGVIGDLTAKLGSSPKILEEATLNDVRPERLLRQFLHPRDPGDFLDLSVMLLPHVPNLYLFIARRRNVPSLEPRLSTLRR